MRLLDPDRFELHQPEEDGLLLDVERGAFFRLNRSATSIAKALLSGQGAGAELERLAKTVGVEAPRILTDADALVAELMLVPEARPSSNAGLLWRADDDALCLWHEGRPVLVVDPTGSRVQLSERASLASASQILLWAAPHLLALHGRTVLHASSVELDGAVHAFCGSTGAGKTTVAEVLGDQRGVRLVGEDLLLVAAGSKAEVQPEAEAIVRAWCEVEADREGAIELRTLLDAIEGARSIPLERFAFVGPRVADDAIFLQALDPIEAMSRFLLNSFAELGRPQIWRDVFSVGRRLCDAARLFELRVPEGLERLRDRAPDLVIALRVRR